ncbi:MAG TPA: PAS domain-containing sensor histidine kinase [Bacteriovoracaceae bacterium]|nr:PAS domain-containing sensor histidine kinase [Bacteriovoracaceae bacterium]
MLDRRLLTFIGTLTSFEDRPSTAKKLANALGASDLIIFTNEPALNVLLPVPGLPQTLPQGRKWQAFLSECLERRQHVATLISPYDMTTLSVMGIAAADGSILVLLGGKPHLEMAVEVSILVPLLASALNTERVANYARGQIATESESVKQAQALANTLDEARRELQNALMQVEVERAKFENLFLQAPIAICMLEGPDHVYILENQAYFPLVGNRNVVGKPIREALPELEGQGIYEILDHVYQTGEPYYGKELPVELINDEGKIRKSYYNFVYQPWLDLSGKIIGILVIATNVEAQVEARKIIEQSEAHFRTLADSMPQLAWMANADGSIYWYNQGWYKYTGTTHEQMEGWGWQSVHDPNELSRVLELWKSSIRTGKPFEMEFPLKGDDGNFRWFLTRATPIRNDQGEILRWLGTNTDVEDQRQAIFNLERERSLREKFVATLTHDLSQPMAAAKISAQLILRNPDQIDSTIKQASRIVQSLNRLDKMIQDLLDVNLIRAEGKLPITIDKCELVSLTTDTLSDLTTVHGDRFILDAPNEIIGYWDAGGLRRILENLLNNAIKYGADCRPVRVSLKMSSYNVALLVHNEGNPLNSKDQIKIFEPYKRTSAAQTGTKKGWGLGLTLVQGIAEAHGGNVKVESDQKTGTTFIVELPYGNGSNS